MWNKWILNNNHSLFLTVCELIGGWLVWAGLGCWQLFSMHLSPPAPASPGMFLAWQWQRSRRASGSTQDHLKPIFNISTPLFLLNPLIKANRKAEPKVKRWGVPSPAADTTQVYGTRVGLRIGATDAIYQRPVNQAVLFLPTAACWFLFLFLSLTCMLVLIQVLTTMGINASLGCGWHWGLLSHSAPSPLCNCKLQRRNSIFKLLHHQVGHICEVTVCFLFEFPYILKSLFFLQ